MANKWIVQGEEFIFANIDFHRNLKNKNNKESIKGGGEFRFDLEKKELLLFGFSVDFGSCEKEDVEKAVKNYKPTKRLKGFKVYFNFYYEFEFANDNKEFLITLK